VTTTVVIVLGALCGGFVTGLAGFGSGLTALAFWLHVVNPVVAAALVAACSVIGQAQSLYTVRRAITWRRVWPFIAGGIFGVPVGVAGLRFIDPQTLKVFLGVLLIGYAGVMLWFRRLPNISWGGRAADGIRIRQRRPRWRRGALRCIAHDLVRFAGMERRRSAGRVSTV
jgi:uncharacterized protein